MSKEEWRDVKGYEGIYRVSNAGRVMSLKPGKRRHRHILKPYKRPDGYLEVDLWRDGKHKTLFVHRLVAEAFLEKPSPDHDVVNHRNGNKIDDRTDNLEWVTGPENEKHAAENGLKAHGEANGNARLTRDDAVKIRKLDAAGKHSQRELGKMFGVHHSTIGDIVRRETWKHVP